MMGSKVFSELANSSSKSFSPGRNPVISMAISFSDNPESFIIFRMSNIVLVLPYQRQIPLHHDP